MIHDGPTIWVADTSASAGCLERLGDARRLADALGADVRALVLGGDEASIPNLIYHGADRVFWSPVSANTPARIQTLTTLFQGRPPRVVLFGGDAPSREWAAGLAVRHNWFLASPTLLIRNSAAGLAVTELDHSGKRSRTEVVKADATLISTMRLGVAEPISADESRVGQVVSVDVSDGDDALVSQIVPPDPSTVDIRQARSVVAGGRGLGGGQGFDLLRRFAAQIGASVAASRVAVDLGWIGHERQVGQTGKTVQPELYIACGISGASHHLDGMSHSKHVIAINTDQDAAIFQVADLGLVADLHQVLEQADEMLAEKVRRN